MSASGGIRPVHRRDGFIVVFWLHGLFLVAKHLPAFLRWTESMWIEWGWRISRHVREALLSNAARILGPRSDQAARVYLARNVMRNFFRFVVESAECTDESCEAIHARISKVEHFDRYRATRNLGKGAIIATAHMGSFEVALASLTMHERRVHVVFQRDLFRRFNEVRSKLRARMGVIEHELEEGWPMWVRLREALGRNEVVLLQADRVLTGQRGVVVPFLTGHIRVPTGHVRLAAMTGSPLIPVFSTRESDGRIRVEVDEPLFVPPTAGVGEEMVGWVSRLAARVERRVALDPQQWLMVQKVFVEDQGGSDRHKR